MEENNLEQETLETPETEPLEELALPEVVQEQTAEDYSKVAETNKKLYARAKKAEEALKQLREKPTAPASVPVKTQEDPIESVLRLRSEGFTDGEILELRNEAKNLGISVPTLLSNPIFKAGIEAKRQKASIESATPSPSARPFTISGKSVSDLSEKEIAGNYADISQKAIQAGRAKRAAGG